MNRADEVLVELVETLETQQRSSAWAYQRVPWWRFVAKRAALAAAEALTDAACTAVRALGDLRCEQLGK